MLNLSLVLPLLTVANSTTTQAIKDPDQHLERTSFQSNIPYQPRVDIKSDIAMVYGIDANMPERIETWRREGYIIHVMTGVAWGDYSDFLKGEWDGVNHEDAAQMDKNGKEILHNPGTPYMCPTETYGKYLCVGVKRAIDAGAEAIHLEEPEFWVHGGYSESFKCEWKAYYNENWVPPHSSPDAQYRASKLKYYLYRRALKDVFTFVREYGKQIGRDVKCYVPTHSMLSYCQIGIVSPECSLAQIPGCDGYIGQVWTGTARYPSMYKGLRKERTFEFAFYEYGILHNLVRSTGKRMWYLNDPVEDDRSHCWSDYKTNWESTLVASLLWPDVWRYEVMPWPSRVFVDTFPKANPDGTMSTERESIPSAYATELLTVINELNNMNQKQVSWDCGTHGIGILVSDTMMFQRGEPYADNPPIASFLGLAMPLIKRGVPIEPVQFENATIPNYLDPYNILFLTYHGMKPASSELHDALVKWVKAGGVLVVVDDDKDPYNSVREWWNTAPLAYSSPRLNLFEKLGIKNEIEKRIGKGFVYHIPADPALYAESAKGDQIVADITRKACTVAGLKWKETGYLLLNRGPYVIAGALDEIDDLPVRTLEGSYIDLFSPVLATRTSVTLSPGSRVFLLDLNKINRDKPRVIASASNVLEAEVSSRNLKFHSEGPSETICVTRVLLPSVPKSITAGGKAITAEWDASTSTALITYPNNPQGLWVEVNW
ncbi:MAG: hypothetical protein ABFD54_03295 [Armatimonadota bacterium]|nr:hypothetical protein [bacterium]